MNVSREDMKWAVSENLLTVDQEARLWEGLSNRGSDRARFDTAHVAFYFGAMVVVSAMAWFLTEAWNLIDGAGLTAIALIYAVVFVAAGCVLWDRQRMRTPAGLLFTLAVWMTPIAIFGIERMTGIWPGSDPGAITGYHRWVQASWVLMEAGMVVAGLVALRFRRFPFLTFPIAYALWYLSMDLVPLLTGTNDFSFDERAWISLLFGGVMLAGTYLLDLSSRQRDLTFWGYFFGLTAFWGGLVSISNDSETQWLAELLVNLALIGLSLVLRRRVFLVFGSGGVAIYLGHLAWDLFEDSLAFPLVLTVIGLAIIAMGIAYQRQKERIEEWVARRLPRSIRALVPDGMPQV